MIYTTSTLLFVFRNNFLIQGQRKDVRNVFHAKIYELKKISYFPDPCVRTCSLKLIDFSFHGSSFGLKQMVK